MWFRRRRRRRGVKTRAEKLGGLAPDPKHNWSAHANRLSSAIVFARKAKWSTRVDIWGKVRKFISFQRRPCHFKSSYQSWRNLQKSGWRGGKEGVDLNLLNVLFIRESLPGEQLEDTNLGFHNTFALHLKGWYILHCKKKLMSHFFNSTLKKSLVKQLEEGLIYYTLSLNIYRTPELAK